MTLKRFFSILLLTLSLQACLPDNRDHSGCAPSKNDILDKGFATQHFVTVNDEMRSIFIKEKKGLYLGEGDIAFNLSSLDTEANATTGTLWSNRTFNYKIHPEFKRKSWIPRAIKRWKKRLGNLIQFVDVTGRDDVKNYVEFVNDPDGCWSYVGMVGGRQKIGLAKGCGVGATTHEIGHALGLWHEQTRNDRDDYVDIKWCNIKEDERHNFFKSNTRGQIVGPYDYNSVMHYPRGAFSTNKYVTIQSKTSTPVAVFSKRRVTKGDAFAITCLYDESVSCKKY